VQAVVQGAEQFDTTVAETTLGLDDAVELDASDEFVWVDLLPTTQQLRLLNSTMELLTAVLALIGVLASVGVPIALAAAAEVLVRLASVLLDRIEGAENP